MILRSLETYYDRLAQEGAVPPEGFSKKEIPFLVVISPDGVFSSLQDTRSPNNGKLVARTFLVPAERGRSGSKAWETSNLLWDHYGYVFGYPKSADASHVDMARKQHQTFVQEVRNLHERYPEDLEITAVVKFLSAGDFKQVFSDPLWPDCQKIPGCNFTFIVSGFGDIVCANKAVSEYVSGLASRAASASAEDDEEGGDLPDEDGVCLVSGGVGPLSRLHGRTPIYGSKSNAKIVAFQKNMGFDSYGKEQGYNAPIGVKSSHAFTTALSHMLARNSKQKILVGDATAVFWAGKKHVVEDIFADLFVEPLKENPDQAANAIRALYAAPDTGSPPPDLDDTPFYVLGLSPNSARLSVRFWYEGTVETVAGNIKAHFDDISMDHGPNQPDYLSLFRLLVSTAVLRKSENIPHGLAGDFMKSILSGFPYPRSAMGAAVTRNRAEMNVTYERASLIKAVLARSARNKNSGGKEVGMSLDKEFSSTGYLLGRLFAVLEKTQEEANPGINATIRDRFYGAASGAPVAAFHHLMKIKNHHLSKLENRGRAVNLERLIGEIVDKLPADKPFPSHLPLDEQGRFAVGYYHQRQSFFRKAE